MVHADSVPLCFRLSVRGVVLDLSDFTHFSLTVTRESAPENRDNELGVLNGLFRTNGKDGLVDFTPDVAWPVGKYFYGAKFRDGNDKTKTFVHGKWTIIQNRDKT